jgi:glycosyltransferase involved in cell wall biosynthesis
MPLGTGEPERAALTCGVAVVTTSEWTRDQLLRAYGLPPDRVHVARPGVDPAPLTTGSPDGGCLLCVAAVSRHKGHDLLLHALSGLGAAAGGTPWSCVCVGSLDRDPDLVADLRRSDLGGALTLAGPRTGPDLRASYAAADLLVLASRGETYGMVVTEALAHGVPVLATAVGGVPEALGHTPDGARPGLLVEPEDPSALAAALATWLTDADLRHRLRVAAAARRDTLTSWDDTAATVAKVLTPAEGVGG